MKYFKVADVKYKLNFKMMITKMMEGEGSFFSSFFLDGEGERGFTFRAYKLFRSESKKNIQFFRILIFPVSVHIDHNKNIAHFLDIFNFIILNYWGRVRTLRPL